MFHDFLDWLKRLTCKHEWSDPDYMMPDFGRGRALHFCKKCGEVTFSKNGKVGE